MQYDICAGYKTWNRQMGVRHIQNVWGGLCSNKKCCFATFCCLVAMDLKGILNFLLYWPFIFTCIGSRDDGVCKFSCSALQRKWIRKIRIGNMQGYIKGMWYIIFEVFCFAVEDDSQDYFNLLLNGIKESCCYEAWDDDEWFYRNYSLHGPACELYWCVLMSLGF